jgi:hypothetical protein
MIKTIMPGDYDWLDRQAVLVDVGSRGIDLGQMQKRAAAGLFRDVRISPKPGRAVMHVIALGDSERYGANRNGDFFYGTPREIEFPEPAGSLHSVKLACGNVDRAWTFEKYGKVYRDHKNKKTDRAYGDVLKAAHNPAMARTELLIDVPSDDPAWRDDVEKVANGEDIYFSMSCKVPGDHCSICGNFAPTRKSYCRHLKDHMSELTKSGHRVGMINDHMVYFDISRVRVPADRIAYSLLKVAGLGGLAADELDVREFDVPAIDKADDPFGVFTSKLSEALHKLSNIEKRIEVVGRAPNESLAFDPDVMGPIGDDELKALGASRSDVGKVLAALADKKICLSLPEFVRLVLGDRAKGVEGSTRLAADSLPGVFSRLAEEADAGEEDMPEPLMADGDVALPRRVMELIDSLKDGLSLDDAPVARRVTIVAIRKRPAPELKKAAALHDDTADRMLRAYASYKVAWCRRNGIDSRATKLAVLQHYVGSN